MGWRRGLYRYDLYRLACIDTTVVADVFENFKRRPLFAAVGNFGLRGEAVCKGKSAVEGAGQGRKGSGAKRKRKENFACNERKGVLE